MCDRLLADSSAEGLIARAPAEAVATILDDEGVEGPLGRDGAVDDRHVPTIDRVHAEGLGEDLLRRERAREDDEAGRLLVDAVDDTERRLRRLLRAFDEPETRLLLEGSALACFERNRGNSRR